MPRLLREVREVVGERHDNANIASTDGRRPEKLGRFLRRVLMLSVRNIRNNPP